MSGIIEPEDVNRALYDFEGFPRIARLSREIVITEKIDGTNAQILIGDPGDSMFVGSRNRWLTTQADNFGFARWCNEHFDELLTLGPGRHFGEWFGAGIQRGYGLKEKRFALFNVGRWACSCRDASEVICTCGRELPPACCTVVPVLYRGAFSTEEIQITMRNLLATGSRVAPGYRNPEGIVIYHTAAKALFKKTFEHDSKGKPI